MPLLRTLGSEQDARLIYEAKRRPKGWKRLGRGAYRTAFLSPSGIVYKVAHDYEPVGSKWNPKGLNNNDEEFENYVRIMSRNLSYRGWRIPQLYAYTWIDEMSSDRITVNAMEYVSGYHEKRDDEDDDFYESGPSVKAFERFGLFDCQTANYVVGPDGRRYIVDLAC